MALRAIARSAGHGAPRRASCAACSSARATSTAYAAGAGRDSPARSARQPCGSRASRPASHSSKSPSASTTISILPPGIRRTRPGWRGPSGITSALAMDAQAVGDLEDALDLAEGDRLEHRASSLGVLSVRRRRVDSRHDAEAAAPPAAAALARRGGARARGRARPGRELGGARAARAVAPDASLERDLGPGQPGAGRAAAAPGDRVRPRASTTACCRSTRPAALAPRARRRPARRTAGARRRARSRGRRRGAAARPRPPSTRRSGARAQAEPDAPARLPARGRRHASTRSPTASCCAEAAAVAGGLRERGIAARATRWRSMLPTGRRLPARLPGHPDRGRRARAHLSRRCASTAWRSTRARQSAILADAGVRAAGHHRPRARRVAGLLQAARALAARRGHRGRAGRRGRDLGGAGGRGRGSRLHPVHVGQHGRAQGRAAHPRQPARQHPRHRRRRSTRGPTDVGASWLPLYHDMGLIGSWLFCHARRASRSPSSRPLAFLSRPERWLWAIHAAPRHALRRPQLRLRAVRAQHPRRGARGPRPLVLARAPSTARSRSARRRSSASRERFAPYGFRREAHDAGLRPGRELGGPVLPAAWAAGRASTAWRASRSSARAGRSRRPAATPAPCASSPWARALPDARGAHRGRRRRATCPSARVGRLVFRGPSMTAGLLPPARGHRRHHAARAAGSTAATSPIARDGEIYIAGRRKDLIIKAGRNLVPQEIEEVAAAVDGDPQGLRGRLRRAPARARARRAWWWWRRRAPTDPARPRRAWRRRSPSASRPRSGVPPDVVALVPPGAVPKTSSGKVRRAATRDLYLRGHARRAARTPPALQARLRRPARPRSARPPAAARPARALYAAYLACARRRRRCRGLGAGRCSCPRRRAGPRARRGSARALLPARWPAAGSTRRGPRARSPGRAARPARLQPRLLRGRAGSCRPRCPATSCSWPRRRCSGWPLVGTFVRKRRPPHRRPLRRAARAWPTRASVARALEHGRVASSFFPEGTFTARGGPAPVPPGRLQGGGGDRSRRWCPSPCAARAQSCARRRWRPRPGPHPPLDRASRSRPKATAGAPWSRCATAWPTTIAAHCGEPRLDLVAGGPGPAVTRSTPPADASPTSRRRAQPRRALPAAHAAAPRVRRARAARRWLKLECWQPTGSFKVRGALNVLAPLTAAERGAGVVAASAGNHALGVAFAVQAAGRRHAGHPLRPRDRARGPRWTSCARSRSSVGRGRRHLRRRPRAARAHARAHGRLLRARLRRPAHRRRPGHGRRSRSWTQLPDVGTVVVPVGGGGLIAGIAAAVKARRPDVRVVAVQPEASPALRESLRAGPAAARLRGGAHPRRRPGRRHRRDRVRAPRPHRRGGRRCRRRRSKTRSSPCVTDDQVIAEGSGAVGVAALRAGRVRRPDGRPAAVVVTGANIDAGVLGAPARPQRLRADVPRRYLASRARLARAGRRWPARSWAALLAGPRGAVAGRRRSASARARCCRASLAGRRAGAAAAAGQAPFPDEWRRSSRSATTTTIACRPTLRAPLRGRRAHVPGREAHHRRRGRGRPTSCGCWSPPPRSR